MPGARQLFDRAFGVGTFGYVFQIRGFDPLAEGRDDRAAPDFMLEGPPEIPDRTKIDEADFQFAGGIALHSGQCSNDAGAHHGSDSIPVFHRLAPGYSKLWRRA